MNKDIFSRSFLFLHNGQGTKTGKPNNFKVFGTNKTKGPKHWLRSSMPGE